MITIAGSQATLERAARSLPAVGAAVEAQRQALVLAVYVATIFTSATLLFVVQPLFARMVLPLLGGSPAVWNTTVVFYQAVLLGGYLYAHLATKRLGAHRQAVLHVGLLLLPLLVLPIGVPAGWAPPTEDNPIPWLLALLTVSVGLPFFVVSASSPMLQRWFVGTGHRSAADPYFLYAASNVGSMLALLSYPLVLEPSLRLADQSWLWAAGYALLAGLTLACAVLLWRSPRRGPVGAAYASALGTTAGRITAARRLRWVLLALVPSSLMLSVTTYVSNNIVPIPLLWVAPLAIYLLTFILVFAGRPPIPHRVMVRALPIVLLPLVMAMIAQAAQPLWLLIALHVAAFFVVAMVCHGEMALDRPSPRHLTEFYLWMSVGGVLGGMLNGLLAPTLFTTVVEYPLILVLACLVQRSPAPPSANPYHRRLDVILPVALGLAAAGLIWVVQEAGMEPGPLRTLVIFGLPAVVCYGFSRRPVRYGLGIVALFLASLLHTSELGTVLHAERTFYGIHRVVLDPDARFHMLANGGTLHGMQSLDPVRRETPLTYFYPSGPLGQVFAAFSGPQAKRQVAVVGLGAGSMACYAQPGQRWTYFELDPVVVRIARDERSFTFLRDCTPEAPIVLGDARLALARTDARYDLLILDAYSSDAPPVHLLTREALALYLERLAPGGVLVFNVSNDFLDLKPVLAGLAKDAGLAARAQDDLVIDRAEAALGKRGSQWVVMAREEAHLGRLAADPRWASLTDDRGMAVWTDDFSSILSVLKRR